MSDHIPDITEKVQPMTLDGLIEIFKAREEKLRYPHKGQEEWAMSSVWKEAADFIHDNREALEAGIKRSAILELAESLLKMAEPEGTIETITEVPNDYYKPQTPATGVNAYFGTWPGDETEEELLALLDDDEEVPE